ncbi:two-component regulator propeller domain-containing protein [Pedobacter sp. AW31-3R]|uniref:two-component regulator propeller domain-containing protein n=1 Tax=Pedobacter sp. AW31-3R TaxID=3445781 RepID=UPI003FA065FF
MCTKERTGSLPDQINSYESKALLKSNSICAYHFRIKLYQYTFILLFYLFPAVCCAQTPVHYFKNYQVNQGLFSNTVTSVTQDKKGFMWFGTRNGLNRFDGSVFRNYKHLPGDSHSLGSNSILSLHTGSTCLWVGTARGLYLYHPEEDSFSRLKGIPAGEVRFITEDLQHNLWIICNEQLYQYNPQKKTASHFAFKNDAALSLHLSDQGTLWVSTTAGNLQKLEAKGQSFQTYTLPNLPAAAKINAINGLYSLGDTTLILGTVRQILAYNLKTNTLSDIGKKNNLGSIFVHTIAAPSKTELWLGTETGLCILNTQHFKTQLITKAYNNPYSITDNIVSAIYKDREGGTWLGTYFGGINYTSGSFNYFHKYDPAAGKHSIGGNLVHEICRDNLGNLWIGTEDSGLNKMELSTGKITNYLPTGEKGSISYHNIHGLAVDGNELWIGTFDHGLDVMDIRTGKVVRNYRAGNAPNQLKSDFIVTLYRTGSGDILAGTWKGLFRYNRRTNDFSPYKGISTHVQSILEDKKGNLWVGTYGSGVYEFAAGSNAKKQLAPGIINANVNNVYEDSHEKLWICTEGGLYRYDPLSRKLNTYTTHSGLPNPQVFRIMEDQQGLFWISTGKGLCRFNPATKAYKNFYATHGLPTEQFNYNSSFKDKSGTLYFGTLKGMISFQPADFKDSPLIAPIYITNIQVNNSDISKSPYADALEKDILYTAQLSLPYTASNINFDVATLSYLNPETNRYQYKLEGFDQQWTTADQQKRIFYSKLPPGKYTFMLRGQDREGSWNGNSSSLQLHISPPWWQTKLAYSLYLLLSAAMVFTMASIYRKAAREKRKRVADALERAKEQEIYSAKIDFFTNVAHEIRTPLTLIKMPLDKLLKEDIKDPEMKENLMMMKKNTNRLIDLSNELLDFRKAEANKFSLTFSRVDINAALAELYTTFRPIAEEKSLQYQIELPRMPLQASVDAEAFRKIISNLISNAIKYGSTSVIVRLVPFSSEDDFFHVEFRNDGNVIAAEMGEKIFEPFYRINGDHTAQGTGIGLPLARSLAELHQGKLELKKGSDQDENVFLLSLPIHQDQESSTKNPDTENEVKEDLPEKAVPTDTSKPGILLVEDHKDILDYLTRELSEDYQILKATNGIEALELLQQEHIQLVISDIMMPIMDGVELCRKIKNDFQYSHIPIILLTARTSINAKIEGLEAGADAYIEKPFSLEHLHAQVNSLLMNRKSIRDYFASSPLTHMKGMGYARADKEFLEKLNDTIYHHITDPNLDVEHLSNRMNVSKATLYRKIKGLSNLTPNELINLTRLKKAAELLASGDYKINEVANLIGYSLPSNFSRDFQKQFGMSPSIYLQKIKSGDQSL